MNFSGSLTQKPKYEGRRTLLSKSNRFDFVNNDKISAGDLEPRENLNERRKGEVVKGRSELDPVRPGPRSQWSSSCPGGLNKPSGWVGRLSRASIHRCKCRIRIRCISKCARQTLAPQSLGYNPKRTCSLPISVECTFCTCSTFFLQIWCEWVETDTLIT